MSEEGGPSEGRRLESNTKEVWLSEGQTKCKHHKWDTSVCHNASGRRSQVCCGGGTAGGEVLDEDKALNQTSGRTTQTTIEVSVGGRLKEVGEERSPNERSSRERVEGQGVGVRVR